MTTMRSYRASNRTNRPRRSPRKSQNNSLPPIIRGNVEGTHTFRFKQTELATANISLYADDLAFCMAVATGGSSVKTIWESLKIQKISIWTPSRQQSGTLQDPRETSLTWLGQYAPRAEVFGTVNQQTGVCAIHAYPPRDSSSGKWQKVGQGSSQELLCSMTIPEQSIVDITLSFVFDDDSTTGINVSTYSGLSIGNLYYSAADSYWGSKRLAPMGMIAP